MNRKALAVRLAQERAENRRLRRRINRIEPGSPEDALVARALKNAQALLMLHFAGQSTSRRSFVAATELSARQWDLGRALLQVAGFYDGDALAPCLPPDAAHAELRIAAATLRRDGRVADLREARGYN